MHQSHVIDLLARYARAHRDRRNIATHLLGVPMVVLAVALVLSQPRFAWGGVAFSPAWVLCLVAVAWCLTRGAPLLGMVTSVGVVGLTALAHLLPVPANGLQVLLGGMLLAFGVLLQAAGHYYEGRRLALAEDVAGLPAGPLFVTLELLSGVGACRDLLGAVEARVGPTRLRNLAHPA